MAENAEQNNNKLEAKESPVNAKMAKAFSRALENIARYGDTDIFPFPIENHIFHDKRNEVMALLGEAYAHFDNVFLNRPPSHIHVLAPAGQTGFRWASQQDPFWNAFLLGVTIALSSGIEDSRIEAAANSVFSYRIDKAPKDGSIFREDIGWREFIAHSSQLATEASHVLVCDIADCYQRIPHHRLENALRQVDDHGIDPSYIMQILTNFSGSRSYGVPIGGPAARILVESFLNLSDRLLRSNHIRFVRYADDYHIFIGSLNEAYEVLRFLSEKLARNEGLTLQKSKTRIMASTEFLASQSLLMLPEEDDINSDIRHLFSLKLRYDPYSDTSIEDYESLKLELQQIDVVGILNRELAKTRVHGAVTKKLIQSVRHLTLDKKEGAVLSLIANLGSKPNNPLDESTNHRFTVSDSGRLACGRICIGFLTSSGLEFNHFCRPM